jgi:predicted nucleotidyltransferase
MNLPKVRIEMLNKIIEKLSCYHAIEGIFLGGSIAQGNEDLFSDIDLRIVVSEDQFDAFVQDKRRIVSEFGEVLFFEDTNRRAPYTIAHYSNFLKVDMFIYTFSRIQPSFWLQGIKIIKDPSNRLHEILRLSNEMTYQVTQEEFELWQGKVFAYVHEVYRRVLREEYYYALTMINNLRSYIVIGWNMEAGRRSNEAWDWSKIEGARSQLEPWQLTMLSNWMCGRNQEEIMKTLCSMIPEISRLYDVLCKKTGVQGQRDKFDRIISMVL